MAAILINGSRGLRLRTPGYFSLAGKVPKRAFKGGGCSDSPSPLKNPSTHNGFSRGLRPLAKEATPHALRECPALGRTTGGYAGVSKGGRAPPFASSWGWGSQGRDPIERVPPRAPFCLLFRRGKSRPGYGAGEAPCNRGPGPEAPKGFGKKHVSFPPARRWANLSASVPCVGTDYQ